MIEPAWYNAMGADETLPEARQRIEGPGKYPLRPRHDPACRKCRGLVAKAQAEAWCDRVDKALVEGRERAWKIAQQ